MEIRTFKNGKQLHAYLKEIFKDLFEDKPLKKDTRSFTIQISEDIKIKSLEEGDISLLNELGDTVVYYYSLNIGIALSEKDNGLYIHVYSHDLRKVDRFMYQHFPDGWEFIGTEEHPPCAIYFKMGGNIGYLASILPFLAH